MERLQVPQKLLHEKFYVTKEFYAHEIAAVNLSKYFFLKNKENM